MDGSNDVLVTVDELQVDRILNHTESDSESEADSDGEPMKTERGRLPGSLYTPVGLYRHNMRIYQGVDDDGRFKFAANITTSAANTNDAVRERYMASLALTEACLGIRMGKISYFPMPTEMPPNRPAVSPSDRATAAGMYHRLPKLVYEPFEWGPEDVDLWQETNHGGMFPPARDATD
ncbi:MAG: hypothetical protein Q9198_009088 [Flavoplaca austrocitrina]